MMKLTVRSLTAAAALGILPALACAQNPLRDRAPAKTIAQIATENGNFKTLVAALSAAGLVETLQGPGPFTVFAPTDAAFAKLPPGTVQGLLGDRPLLTSILTYHVVPGRILARDVMRMQSGSPATVNGQLLDVVVRRGKVYVNGAQVVTTDIIASNGVIHVIDAVLMPKAEMAGSAQ